MANKYTKWGDKNFYSNIDKLAEDYESYVTIPFYYGCECTLKLQSCQNRIEYDGNIKTDYTEMMIVGILSTGYNMTLLQLRSYLCIKGIQTNNSALKERLDYMILKGLVIRHTIYDPVLIMTQKTGEVKNRVISYQLTNMGNLISGIFGAFGNTFQRIKRESRKCVNLMGTLINGILWNQIVLNQLVFNPSLQNFKIENITTCEDGKRREIPLHITAKERKYYFVYTYSPRPASYERILQEWLAFAGRQESLSNLVIVTDRNNDMELLDMCFKACNTFHTLISVTCVKEWFTCRPGRVMCVKENI